MVEMMKNKMKNLNEKAASTSEGSRIEIVTTEWCHFKPGESDWFSLVPRI